MNLLLWKPCVVSIRWREASIWCQNMWRPGLCTTQRNLEWSRLVLCYCYFHSFFSTMKSRCTRKKSYFKMVTKRSIEHLHQANLDWEDITLPKTKLNSFKWCRTRENGLIRTHHFRYIYITKTAILTRSLFGTRYLQYIFSLVDKNRVWGLHC